MDNLRNDDRKQQLQDMATKYNFDLNQKLSGVFLHIGSSLVVLDVTC